MMTTFGMQSSAFRGTIFNLRWMNKIVAHFQYHQFWSISSGEIERYYLHNLQETICCVEHRLGKVQRFSTISLQNIIFFIDHSSFQVISSLKFSCYANSMINGGLLPKPFMIHSFSLMFWALEMTLAFLIVRVEKSFTFYVSPPILYWPPNGLKCAESTKCKENINFSIVAFIAKYISFEWMKFLTGLLYDLASLWKT